MGTIVGGSQFGADTFGGTTGSGPSPTPAYRSIQDSILYPALRIAGVIMSPGRGYAPEILADTFEMYNTLLDEWANQELLVYHYYQTIQNLVALKMTYKIGPASIDPTVDFNLVRPPRIEFASILVFVGLDGNSIPIRRQLEIRHVQDRASVTLDKTYSAIPLAMYYDMGYPIGLIDFWPIPQNSINQLEMWLWEQLQQAAAPSDLIALPPGYRKALQYNLAKDISSRPWNVSKPMNSVAYDQARTSLAWVKSLNQEVHQLTMRTESAAGEYSAHRGRFDIFTGHFTLG